MSVAKNQFSRDFLGKCIAKISDTWKSIKLKVVLYNEIPARIRKGYPI